MGESFSFRDIMRKMEARFGSKELPETSRTKFQQATQQPGEMLEDWADRVLTLATPAFRDLPDQFGQREAVTKFCQGCIDKKQKITPVLSDHDPYNMLLIWFDTISMSLKW